MMSAVSWRKTLNHNDPKQQQQQQHPVVPKRRADLAPVRPRDGPVKAKGQQKRVPSARQPAASQMDSRPLRVVSKDVSVSVCKLRYQGDQLIGRELGLVFIRNMPMAMAVRGCKKGAAIEVDLDRLFPFQGQTEIAQAIDTSIREHGLHICVTPDGLPSGGSPSGGLADVSADFVLVSINGIKLTMQQLRLVQTTAKSTTTATASSAGDSSPKKWADVCTSSDDDDW